MKKLRIILLASLMIGSGLVYANIFTPDVLPSAAKKFTSVAVAGASRLGGAGLSDPGTIICPDPDNLQPPGSKPIKVDLMNYMHQKARYADAKTGCDNTKALQLKLPGAK